MSTAQILTDAVSTPFRELEKQRPAVEKVATEMVSQGCMIALVPPKAVAEQLAEYGDEPIDQLHVTLVYLGKLGEDDIDPEKTADVLEEWADTTPRLKGTYAGHCLFAVSASSDGKVPEVVTVDCPGLTRARTRLVDLLDAAKIAYHDDHDFVPHTTVSYVDESATVAPLDEPISVTFSSVSLFIGEDEQTFKLLG
jgi:2'-5' RNA ligase